MQKKEERSGQLLDNLKKEIPNLKIKENIQKIRSGVDCRDTITIELSPVV